MKSVAAITLTAIALAFAGTSSVALAQSKGKTAEPIALVSDSYISDETTTLSKPENKSKIFQFDVASKWGLMFDVNQAESRPAGMNDVDAGAFFKLTPSVRVGGTVGFGEKTEAFKPDVNKGRPDAKSQPRVRLETTFKF